MKAAVYEKYGAHEDVLELKEVNKPTPKDNEVLVKIHATGINFADYGLIRGKPYLGRLWSGLLKPKNPILGADIAGLVESVGKNAKQFQTGDEVFGDIGSVGWGGFAEYVSVPENVLALKPTDLSFEEAAALPQATHVVLQGLRDHGQIKSGQKVLINGASGNNGSLAVQVAKSFGAEVTGVCSTRNLEFVKSLGADKVIDYTQEDFTKSGQRYDLIFDIAVSHSISDYKRALNPKGAYIAGGFNSTSLFFGPLISMFGSKKVASYMGSPNIENLEFIKELIEAGKVKPAIDKRFQLTEVAEAIQYYKKGAQGKVIINIV
ncbi:MAG: NAD(P)-dependent alcohol dehydrogenase [Candidatus Heimdallarchaeota archaeon]|nr:NAD(P)-dependent alcohol dehydrogenase [Candidatus Heimdallarchaeota archaeon]